MDKKYKILWLDDEFEDSTSPMSKSLEEFEESPFSFEFEVTKVSAAGGFRNMFVSTYFDAVILDVWGKDNFDDSDLSATARIQQASAKLRNVFVKALLWC